MENIYDNYRMVEEVNEKEWLEASEEAKKALFKEFKESKRNHNRR